MGSSYYITYGGNRLTFPGATGSVAWEYPSAMVLLDPGRTSNYDYFKMRFVTPNGEEIILEDGLTATASASAMVPVNSTAYWTANGDQTDASARYHVSSLGYSGFSGMSAYTAVTTGFYTNPNVESYGSAVLTSTGSASAKTQTTPVYRGNYGEGGSSWYCTLMVTSWAGSITGMWGTAAGRGMWIPSGAKVVFSASSVAGKTYTVQPAYTAMPGYEIVYAHNNPGTHSTVSGYMNSAYDFRLGSGRTKNVYGTGTAYTLGTTDSASAAAWQPRCIVTAFSSNLSTGSSLSTFLVGSANMNKVNGFTVSNELGAVKNSAGTWKTVNGTTDLYRWVANKNWVSNSAYMSGYFSAMRHKGATGNNKATYAIYGVNSSHVSYVIKSAQFAVPTASGKTSTLTATATASVTGLSACAANCFSIGVAQRTALRANCRGAWTASGIVQ